MTLRNENETLQRWWYDINGARRGLREAVYRRLETVWRRRPAGSFTTLSCEYRRELGHQIIYLDEWLDEFRNERYGKGRLLVADDAAKLAKAARSHIRRGEYRELRLAMRRLLHRLQQLVFILDRQVSHMLDVVLNAPRNEQEIVSTIDAYIEESGIHVRSAETHGRLYLKYDGGEKNHA